MPWSVVAAVLHALTTRCQTRLHTLAARSALLGGVLVARVIQGGLWRRLQCPKVRWAACPLCQDRIAAEGLADEYELQSWCPTPPTQHALAMHT